MKVKTSVIFICALVAVSFASCRKIIDRGPSSVKGTVVRKSDGKTPVPFATVSLLEKDKNSSIISAGTLETTIADEKGEFSFDFDAEWGYDYAIIAKAENHYETSYPKYITAGRSRNVTFELEPYGFVKLRLINKEPGDLFNRISIDNFCNNETGVTIVNNFDTCITCRLIANGYWPIGYWVTKTYNDKNKNFKTFFSKSFSLPALDTIEATIEY